MNASGKNSALSFSEAIGRSLISNRNAPTANGSMDLYRRATPAPTRVIFPL